MTTLPEEIRKRIEGAVDPDAAVALLRDAVAVPSVTGDEEPFARFIADRLHALGLARVEVDEFADGRANVWSTTSEPSGSGQGLLFAGHLDTVHVRGWQEHWAGTEREDPFGAALVDGCVWGRGVGDLKAGICAVIAALAALRRAGLAPDRPVTTVFVADEESGEPGSGLSDGIRRAVAQANSGRHPIDADFAIYVEPTEMQVYTANMGFFIADIQITGRSAYFGTPELGVDAIKSAYTVLSRLWEYDTSLRTVTPAPLIGRPFLLVTGVTGGGYVAVPGECTISLIRKLTPGEELDQARHELDSLVAAAVQGSECQAEVRYTAARDHPVGGTALVTDPKLPAVQQLCDVVATELPGRGQVAGAPYWSEAPFLANELGIPTVYCAPGDISNCHTFQERVAVDEYLAAVTAFATYIAEHCGLREIDPPAPGGRP